MRDERVTRHGWVARTGEVKAERAKATGASQGIQVLK